MADRPDGFYLNIHDRPSSFMVGRTTIRLEGHAHVRERRIGPTFLVSPTAFFQTNPVAAAVLVDLVLAQAAGERLRVLDLYAGSGLFSLPLALRGHDVIAVEESRQAMHDAARNLAVNRLPDDAVRLVAARVEDALPGLARRPVDLVVLDPPRQGCPPPVIDAVFGRIAPPRAIYVSCNPEALAAELPAILGHGYRAVSLTPVDMFPHTPHIETVAVFERVAGSHVAPRRERDAPGPAAGCQNEAPPMTTPELPPIRPASTAIVLREARCGRRLRGADGAPQPLGGVHGRRLRIPRGTGRRR